MSGKSTPANEAAISFLRAEITRAREDGRERLSTVKALAEGAGVSHPTMLKAVAVVRDEGLVQAWRGRGIVLAGSRPVKEPAGKTRRQHWRSVMMLVERDILQGHFPPDEPLPSHKELRGMYGVSHPTLKKALELLAAKGVLSRFGRGYRVPLVARRPHHGSLVLITRGDRGGTVNLSTPRSEQHIRLIENECSRANTRLRYAPYDWRRNLFDPGSLWLSDLDRMVGRESVLGFVVWPLGLDSELLAYLLRHLVGLNRPVAILDEGSELNVPYRLVNGAAVKLFTMAGTTTATRHVARYLLNLGHRAVAYVSPFHSSRWSRNRLRGLVQTYRRAGITRGVHAYTANSPTEERESSVEFGDVGRALDRLVTMALQNPAPENLLLARATKALRSRIVSAAQEEIARQNIRPLLEKALSQAGVTAWVASNDKVALESLEFLRQSGKMVPEEISVIGLDDSTEAYLNKLTSYNFSGQAVIHAMIDYVLNPSPACRDGDLLEQVEIEGVINVRGTTARARRQDNA